jgi:hypothetical protein
MATVRSSRVSWRERLRPFRLRRGGDWISYGPTLVPEIRAIRARYYSLCSKLERMPRFLLCCTPGSNRCKTQQPLELSTIFEPVVIVARLFFSVPLYLLT